MNVWELNIILILNMGFCVFILMLNKGLGWRTVLKSVIK
ncbi:hypothetical protein BMETH_519_0 [methanotrophic bacterial endosymbiont of Bathymodiolus sp.]|nr:hypothetical protein BMETH_519_0 [methanotrophic bacterial endosymbiont of Bathymodiolus sp.]